MFKKISLILAAVILTEPVSLFAQEENIIIVASQRDDYEYYDDEQSAIGLRKKADFFVKRIFVSSDSRDAEVRKKEVQTMLREAVRLSSSAGIQLVTGNYKLSPVSLGSIDKISLGRGSRPDTSRVAVYAKIPANGSTKTEKQASDRINTFVKTIPINGRSYIEESSVELAITDPDRYRNQVVQTIAREATRYASYFGNDYGVEIKGLDNELSWTQIGENEVLLFIPHNFVIKPK